MVKLFYRMRRSKISRALLRITLSSVNYLEGSIRKRDNTMDPCFKKEEMEKQVFMTKIYLKYERLMFILAGQYASNSFEQEEIVQIALVRLWQKVDTLQQINPCAAASYIAVTIRNTAINYRRKHSKEQVRHVSLDAVPEDLPAIQALPADARLLADEKKAAILRAFRSLAPEDRFLLEGKYFLQCSNEELAAQLNCKPDSIRMKLYRVRKRFLTRLNEEDTIDD